MRGSGARALLSALVVLALVGVVAVASTGSTPSGTSDGRPPADLLLDTFFTLALVLLVPAAAILVYGLAQRKEIAREIASGRYRRAGIGAYLVLAAAFSLAVYLRLTNARFDLPGGQADVVDLGTGEAAAAPEGSPEGQPYEPEIAWIPLVVVLVLVAVAGTAYVVASRRRRGWPAADEDVVEHVADTLDDMLDDLRAEPDPRRAVVAAFARLEQALASSGLPRRPSETAEEYVGRVLGRLEVDPKPVRRLTDLFEKAKFSQHDVDDAMKEEAIAALVRVRDELRQVAERRRREQQEQASKPGRGRQTVTP
jgi:hypothetical protein